VSFVINQKEKPIVTVAFHCGADDRGIFPPYRQFDELHNHEIPGGAPHTVQARVENIAL